MTKIDHPVITARKKLSRFNRLAFLSNILFAGFLLLSYLSQYISPEKLWILAFFGLGYPLFFIINLLFVLYWSVQWKKPFLISLVCILAGWNVLPRFLQLNLDHETYKVTDKGVIKTMSYNVHLFDLYNWTKDKETRDQMIEFIKEESPDVLCLQEIYNDDGEFLRVSDLAKRLNLRYYHVEYTKIVKETRRFGIITLSKFPFVNRGKINFGEKVNNVCIYTDFKIGADTIRVYNMHLQSIHLIGEDYELLKKFGEEQTESVEGSKKILKKVKNAFTKRAWQVDTVTSHIQKTDYPVIVCGDFNDSPVSYTYQTFRNILKDAFVESGVGLGRTYNSNFGNLRIDYILHSESFGSFGFETLPEEYSDHFPITCYMKLKR